MRLDVILKDVQKIHTHFLKGPITFTTFCNQHNIGNLFVIACERGMHQLVAFILDRITSTDLEFLINSTGGSVFYAAAQGGNYDVIKLLSGVGFKFTSFKKPPLYAYIDFLFQLKQTCPHVVSVCRSSQCSFHSSTALDIQEAMVDILLPSKEYFLKVLQTSPEFPFFRLAAILNLKVAKCIFMDLFSIYKSNLALAEQVNWKYVVFSLASKVRFQPFRDWVSVLDEQLVALLHDTVDFDGYTCVITAKANLWKMCSRVIKNCSTPFDDWVLEVVKLVIEAGQMEILKELYSANDELCEWVHTNTSKVIKIAAFNRKTNIVLFLLDQLSTNYEGALAEIIKFEDEPCFMTAIGKVMLSYPSIVEENVLMLLATATKYNRSSLIQKFTALYGLLRTSNDLSFEVSMTLLKTAVRCGHIEIALFALNFLTPFFQEKLSTDKSFHSILYWSCYWGMVKVLQRLNVTSTQLLHRDSEHDFSPWECALVNGHIGKISYLENAPTLAEAGIESFALEKGKRVRFCPEHLFVGTFNNLMHDNMLVDKGESSDLIRFDNPFSKPTLPPLWAPHTKMCFRLSPQACRTLVKCLGRYTGQLICHTGLLCVLCPRISEEAFEILLDAMAETNHLYEYFDKLGKERCECFIRIVTQGSVRRVQALLNHGINIFKYDNDGHSKLSGSLLHSAVQSKSPEMVNLVLNLYGDKVHDTCLREESEGLCPLDLAFALGAAEVLYKTKLATMTDSTSISPWRKVARGWFHLMITENEHFQNSDLCNFVFNIRQVPINELMTKAINYRNVRIVTSMVRATGNISWGNSFNAAYLSVEGGPGFYQGKQFLMELSKEELSKFVSNITKQYHNDQQMLLLIQYLDLSTKEVLTIFHTSCYLNRHKVVCKMLNDRACNEPIRSALSVKCALEEGLLLAIASGNYNTAVQFSLETGLSYESIDAEAYPVAKLVPELSKLIFSQVSYYSILEKFYKSLCECGGSLSLAASWLARNWTQLESQLLVKQLGNTSYAPSNPWLLRFSSENGPEREVLVTVDWDSFSECFVTSPLPVLQDKHRYTPMLVEALVFSPAVLGQVCGHTGSNRTYEPLSLLSDLDQISTMILTAQVWPIAPLFTLYGDQGTLTLSYAPSDGAFVFPTTMSKQEKNPVEDSQMQSYFESLAVTNDMVELCCHFKNQLKKVLWKEVTVSVSCDSSLTFAGHGFVVTQALNDCVNVFSLLQNPHVLYANVHPEVRSKNIESLNKKSTVLNRVEVHFVYSTGYNYDNSSFVSVNRQNTALKIIVVISDPTFELEEDHGLSTNSMYEPLIKELVECLLGFEKESCISLVKNSIQKKILPNLCHSLKIGRLDEDFVSFGVQDSHDSVHGLQDADNISLSQIKNLVKMTTFINSFSKLISVISLNKRTARAMFECGFKVLLVEREITSFTVKGGVAILKLSVLDLHTKTVNDNMVTVFSSVMTAASKTKWIHVDLHPSIPAPFRCHVSMAKSPGLLFPCKSVCGTIIVQLVGYNNTPLTTLPTNQCVLNVMIKDCEGKQIKATSSTDPHFKTAPKHLLINLKSEGFFHILWTPQQQGLHEIFIKLNGVPIVSSPFKIYCFSSATRPGYHQAIAGNQLIFIASHVNHRCQRNVPPTFKVPNRRSILPMCLKAVQPLLKASRVNAKVEPATGCAQTMYSKCIKTDPKMSSCDESQIHYLSMALMHGGHSKWIRKQSNNTIVFISSAVNLRNTSIEKSKVSCVALSNGRSIVAVTSRKACTLKVYAACALCHTVLTTHWIDHATTDPTPCYITPGTLCAYRSTVCHSHNKISGEKNCKLIIDDTGCTFLF